MRALFAGVLLLHLWPAPASAETRLDFNTARFMWAWAANGSDAVLEGFRIRCGTISIQIPDPTAREYPVDAVLPSGAAEYDCTVVAYGPDGESDPTNAMHLRKKGKALYAQ